MNTNKWYLVMAVVVILFQVVSGQNLDSNCQISITSQNLNVSELKVNFYDFQNDIIITSRIGNAFEEITDNIDLDVQRHINIYIPGFRSNITDSPSIAVIQALKNVSNIYFIFFDYSHYSNETLNEETFEKFMLYMFDLGSAMGKFIAQFYEFGFSEKDIRGFGHSAGGQLVGVMGDAFKNTTDVQIARITSIDPARPCFTDNLETQTRSGQAEYVEKVHCQPGSYGTVINVADADFYYNKEDKVYPGCFDNNKNTFRNLGDVDPVNCAHTICVQDYMRTVAQPSWFEGCANYKDYVKNDCANSEIVYSGYHQDNTPKGVFYVSTKVGDPIVPIA